MTFKLYNAPQSTCSQRVRFVFNGKKIPFDEVKLNLLEGDQLKPDYLKLNPNGVVPTLDHDGDVAIVVERGHHPIRIELEVVGLELVAFEQIQLHFVERNLFSVEHKANTLTAGRLWRVIELEGHALSLFDAVPRRLCGIWAKKIHR